MSGTYISKIPVLVVALVIGIVLVTSAVVPLASDYSDAKTFTNEGYFRMNKVTDGNLTFRWDYDNPTIMTVNNETIEYTYTEGQEITVVCSEVFYLRLRNNNASFIYNGPGGNVVADSTGESLTVTIVENSGTVTNGTKSVTFTNVGDIYHISNTGDYSMKKSNESAYMNKDSIIFIRGVSRVGTHYVSFVIDGNIEGVNITGSDVTTEDVEINNSAVNSYIDLYKFDSITFNATYTGDSTPTALTYNYVIVPYEVTADPDNPAAYKNLVKVVPLMAFIMLVVAAAGMIYLKNKD